MFSFIRYSLLFLLLLPVFFLISCDEPCKFDNTSYWTPSDHGYYKCLDNDNVCGSKSCILFVKGPEEGAQWESTGKREIRRPRDMENELDDPNSYKCECE